MISGMRKILLTFCVLSCFLISLVQCKATKTSRVIERGVLADSAMIVSAREEASAIGVAILKKGGNAFDAMIATDLALVVAYPFSGNIGGGGFTVFRTADGNTGTLDYREKAPLAAERDMYLDEDGEIIPDMSTLGAMSIGVPGTIAGLFELHEKFGSQTIS